MRSPEVLDVMMARPPLLERGFELGIELLLDGQVFDDGFDDHVAANGGVEIILEVAHRHQRLEPRREETGRFGAFRRLQPSLRRVVARLPFGRLPGQIEKLHLDTGVGEVGRDRRSHDACT